MSPIVYVNHAKNNAMTLIELNAIYSIARNAKTDIILMIIINAPHVLKEAQIIRMHRVYAKIAKSQAKPYQEQSR